MNSFFKKISTSSALFALFIVCACSEGAASAAGDYVKASSNAEKAAALFAKADYSGALKFAESAEAQIGAIIEKHPESDVAFKIVSDESLRLGPWRYADFKASVLPKMRALADPEMAPFDLPWTISVGSDFATEANILNFSTFAVYYQEQLKTLRERGVEVKGALSPASSKRIAEKAASYLKSSDAKAAFARNMSIADEMSSKTPVSKVRLPFVFVKPGFSQMDVKIENPEKFLSQTKAEVARVAYNLEASQKLLAFSDFVLADNSVLPQFGAMLLEALENTQKISSKKLKNPAVSTIVFALSKIGYNDDALIGSMYIEKDVAIKAACLEKIAYSYMAYGDFDGALNVISGFSEGPKRTEMLLRASMDLARSGNTSKAIDVVSKIKDMAAQSTALTFIAGTIWISENKKAVEMLRFANPAFLSEKTLFDFSSMAGLEIASFASKEARMTSLFCAIASELLPLDKELSARWAATAARHFQLVNDPKEIALLYASLGRLYLDSAKNASVLELLFEISSKGDPQLMIESLSTLALEAGLRGDKALAENLFANAVIVSRSDVLAKSLMPNSIYIAWQAQLSGLEREKIFSLFSEILSKSKN